MSRYRIALVWLALLAAPSLAADAFAETVVTCGTAEPIVATRVTYYGTSQHGPAFPGSLIDPDLSTVNAAGLPWSRWKCAGQSVVPMTTQEQADVQAAEDAAVAAAHAAEIAALATDLVTLGGIGEQGPQGPAGADGAQGPQGIQGPQGVAGSQGPEGPAGADGGQGPQGTQGLPGQDGAQGPQGAQGIQGLQGIQGPEGPEGPAGSGGGVLVVPIHADGGANLTLSNSPVAERFILNVPGRAIRWLPLTGKTQVRLRGIVITASTIAGARMRVLFKTGAYSATFGQYSAIGTAEVSIPLDGGAGEKDSGWIDLAAGAIAEVFVAVTEMGGNATLDPALGAVQLYFQ